MIDDLRFIKRSARAPEGGMNGRKRRRAANEEGKATAEAQRTRRYAEMKSLRGGGGGARGGR